MFALSNAKRNTLIVVLGAFIAAVAAPAMAQEPAVAAAPTKAGQWAKDHPRRVEVNKRLANQHKRVNQKVANGTMSQDTATTLKKEDHQIRQEERGMAAQNGGHITKQEQQTLNQQAPPVERV